MADIEDSVELPLLVKTQERAGEKAQKDRNKAQQQEFFLPINGFISYYPQEVKVINHPAFQRLSKINQLGQAHYVFRGATHKRSEHVLGAVGVVERMIDAVNLNAENAMFQQEGHAAQDWREPLNESEERFIRLGALLHDIGHLAAGHTLEDELGLFGKHDEDTRLDYIFGDCEEISGDDGKRLGKPEWETGTPFPALAKLIDDSYECYVPADLKGLSASRIVRLLIRKPPKEIGDDKYLTEHRRMKESNDLRAEVCTNMIGNTICADLLDYIVRDWYHVGRPIPPEDRIYQYMEVRNPAAAPPVLGNGARRHATDKFVLALGSNAGRAPKIRTDGVSAILSLLERRYELGETVLYHRTKLSAGAMLGRALFELWEGEDIWKELLDRSDEQLVDYALSYARNPAVPESASAAERERIEKQAATAEFILLRLRSRELYKAFYTERHWTLTRDQKDRLTQKFASAQGGGAQSRTLAAHLLEQRFELPEGSIVVSCTNVRPKIAEVEVRINREIKKFNDYEQSRERGLSGGHLRAQEKRFADLWRLDFFMAPEQLEMMKRDRRHVLDMMKDAIEQIFVKPPLDHMDIERYAARIANDYRQIRLKATGRSSRASGTYAPASLATLWSTDRTK